MTSPIAYVPMDITVLGVPSELTSAMIVKCAS